jgi:hypothetical protein
MGIGRELIASHGIQEKMDLRMNNGAGKTRKYPQDQSKLNSLMPFFSVRTSACCQTTSVKEPNKMTEINEASKMTKTTRTSTILLRSQIVQAKVQSYTVNEELDMSESAKKTQK